MIQYILPIIFIVVAGFAFAYSAPAYTSVNLTLGDAYVAPSYLSVNLTLGDSVQTGGAAANDSCLCAGLNQAWVVNLSHYCIINSTCDIGTGALSFIGTGNFTCNASISAATVGSLPNNQRGFVTNNCQFVEG